ncbi:MAG: N-acetylmuramoyl-L-alanine amidase [Flavobacteriaceae bacterium]
MHCDGTIHFKRKYGKLGFKERGVKFANFQVLRETIANCPSVLVEMGFMTHVDEADYYLRSKNIRAMALAILMGLYNYLILDCEGIFVEIVKCLRRFFYC